MKFILGTVVFSVLLVLGFTADVEISNCNKGVQCLMNVQIKRELQAFYFYESMAAYFERPAVGLMGFHKFFRKCADEEIGHARKMMAFVNQRGEKVTIPSLTLPSDVPDTWEGPMTALASAIAKEEAVYASILLIHDGSDDPSVHAFMDFFIDEQIKSIADLKTMKARLGKMKSEILVQMMDDELRSDKK